MKSMEVLEAIIGLKLDFMQIPPPQKMIPPYPILSVEKQNLVDEEIKSMLEKWR